MTEEDFKTGEGRALWRRGRDGWRAPADDEAPDALLLAAYLDGRLAEDEAARLEARLAGEPALLDELLALRATLEASPEAPPAAVIARAQALRPATAAVSRAAAGTVPRAPDLFDRLFGAWLRPAVPALAGIALLLACAGAFELGRYQAAQLDAPQTAVASETDVPVDLLMSGIL
jgi:anti-sigma factor RsiW